MDNENEACPCCGQSAQEALIWSELLGKKLFVSRYNWMNGKTTMGVLRLHKCPDPWEVLEISKHRLILQTFMAVSYPCGEATRVWLEDSKHPIVVDDSGRVIEFLESSIIYASLETTD